MKKLNVYAFVPAKGSSERVANKNMRFLDGDRLFIRALKTLLKCKEVDRVFLDTESEEMFKMCDFLPITFMKRDVALATNKTDGHQMFMNEVRSFPDGDIYVQLLCTSPFIRPETIDSAIRKLRESDDYDSAILMRKEKCYLWKDGKPSYDINHIPNSKDLPDTVTESMGLYIQKKESAIATNRRYGDKPFLVYGSAEELVDVNTPEDLSFAELVAYGRREEENIRLEMLKHMMESAAISDVLDDMRIECGEECGCVLPGWVSNSSGRRRKVIGRATTLKLRRLNDGEDFRGIYGALKSYEGMTRNSVICVQNDVSENAYFGGLNARLAIRSGAVAAIIDGVTRDERDTALLDFPVYSRGYNPQDVRRRATLDYMHKPIRIGGVRISPGDLIFIDDGAVVVIYQKFESEVIERVCKTFASESEISSDIMHGIGTDNIVANHGDF